MSNLWMTLLKGTPYNTVVVNDTIYEWELREQTKFRLIRLQVLKPKPQVKEGDINDEPTGKSNSFEVKIMDDEAYTVLIGNHQLMRQLSFTRPQLIKHEQIIIQYDEKQSKLKWYGIPREGQSSNKNLDIHGTTNSKMPCEQEQKPNDPNGEHPAKEDAKDVIRSPRKTQCQLS
ncbi:hypothetical protein CY35_12G087300 [Sphagnum magellanicum]|nr:hypothetical protein CY35_12G087300 [Sphagnum magellanicum]KAH9546285.1 hypothetical protein CY35_12G087300 [Sphagnum magellanicum]